MNNRNIFWAGLCCLTAACGSPPRADSPVESAGSPSGGSVTQAIEPRVEPALRVRWLGGPTATLQRGGLRVLTDPMLSPRGDNVFTLPKHPSSGALNAPVARYTAPPAFTADGLSAILISHTHNDHFDATAKESLPKQLPVVVASAGAELVRGAGFTDVRALDWNESATLSAAGVTLRVLAVPAHHAHDPQLDHDLGRGNGYVLDFEDQHGKLRVYWTGDAVLTDDSRDFAARYGAIDVLLPHLGGVGGDGGLGLRTMNAEEAVELTKRVAPGLVLPIHHTTFSHYREPIVALEERAKEAGVGERFHFLHEGETFEVRK